MITLNQCCCGGATTLTYNLTGCNSLPETNGTLYLKLSGTIIDTQAPDSTGKVVFNIGSSNTYTVTGMNGLGSRFVAFSDSITMVSGVSQTVNKTLTVNTGYQCLPADLNGMYCAEPQANTLHYPSAFGTVTLLYDSGLGYWDGSDIPLGGITVYRWYADGTFNRRFTGADHFATLVFHTCFPVVWNYSIGGTFPSVTE